MHGRTKASESVIILFMEYPSWLAGRRAHVMCKNQLAALICGGEQDAGGG